MKYEAAKDLGFVAASGDPMAPLDVCVAGTELELVSLALLTDAEADSLRRLTHPKIPLPGDVKIVPFRWDGRVRFLRLGTEARPVAAPPIRKPGDRGETRTVRR